ncbi:MAG: VOC family protein [Pseudonocardiaceae bacterium]
MLGRAWCGGCSPEPVEDLHVELAQALGIGEHVDCDDLPARERSSVKALLDAGAEAQHEVKDVGGGKLIASVRDADGNVIGLIQSA